MPKIIAYTALHYGRTYLDAAIKSVIDSVDEYHVLYSRDGSHGTRALRPCPDSEEELHEIAWGAAGMKLRWHEGQWAYEGQQRDSILQYAGDADMIITVDSDEIYSPKLMENVLYYAHSVNFQSPFRYIRLPFVHFYRDFRHAVIEDPAFPARLTFPKVAQGEATWDRFVGHIAHLGYCQPAETIRYKLGIHGHRSELRCLPDEYVDDIYLDLNRWDDLHPVGSEFWNAEAVDPLDYMPEWMQDHPMFNAEAVV